MLLKLLIVIFEHLVNLRLNLLHSCRHLVRRAVDTPAIDGLFPDLHLNVVLDGVIWEVIVGVMEVSFQNFENSVLQLKVVFRQLLPGWIGHGCVAWVREGAIHLTADELSKEVRLVCYHRVLSAVETRSGRAD